MVRALPAAHRALRTIAFRICGGDDRFIRLLLRHLPARLDAGTLPAFMLGIVASAVSLGQRKKLAYTGGYRGVVLLAAYRQEGDAAIDHADPMWHAAFFALVVAASVPFTASVLSWRQLVYIGGASYSIYIVHQRLAVFFGTHGIFWPLAGILSVVSDIRFWAIVERRLLRDRKRVSLFLRTFFKRYARLPIVIEAQPFEA